VIASITGRVAHTGVDSVVLEVGGFGVSVHCAAATTVHCRPGSSVRLATSLVVREDSLTLYGFIDDDQRIVFEQLQAASGVGPRLALAMLATHSPDALRRAVAAEDHAALALVSGIGTKGARRIALELKDRLGPPREGSSADSGDTASHLAQGVDWRYQLQGALVGLGWPPRQADDAVTAVAPLAAEAVALGSPPDVAVLLRAALHTLSRT
jgi:holliday junction DNA helicase RuvA